MIRSRIEANTQPLDAFSGLIGDIERIQSELVSETYLTVSGPFLDELRYYPPPLPNQKYVRTYQLRRGMEVFHEKNQIIVQNKAHPDKLKYVIGSFNPRLRGKQQAKIHEGRWPLVADTVDFWFDAIAEILNDKLDKYLSAVASSSLRRRNR